DGVCTPRDRQAGDSGRPTGREITFGHYRFRKYDYADPWHNDARRLRRPQPFVCTFVACSRPGSRRRRYQKQPRNQRQGGFAVNLVFWAAIFAVLLLIPALALVVWRLLVGP